MQMANIYADAAKRVLDAADANPNLVGMTAYDENKRQDFLMKYDKSILNNLNDDQILSTMFIDGDSEDSLCGWLKDVYKGFGKIGRFKSQFGIYCDPNKGWIKGNRKVITEAEAKEIGTKTRDDLVNCCDKIDARIKNSGLESLEDYIGLQTDIEEKADGFIIFQWVRKYFYLMYPEYFVSWYDLDRISRFLTQLGIKPDVHEFGKIWQLLQVEKPIAAAKGMKLGEDRAQIGSLCWGVLKHNLLTQPGTVNPDIQSDEDTEDSEEEESEMEKVKKIYETGIKPEWERNRIMFGAPGTGKSYLLNQDKNKLLNIKDADDEKPEPRVERVIFYPDYSYANFVGTYKPVSFKDDDGNESIRYTYVPGPFMRTYIKAWNDILTGDDPQPYLLIIEEINRANAAAVFGDIFQLLDRKGNGYSEYSIQATEDIRRYLLETEGWDDEFCMELRMPDNMFIWATMNSADQGVFPMDTAFKRRWNFEYLGINDVSYKLSEYWVTLGSGADARKVEWHGLRMAINNWMANHRINEDKQIGLYFISRLPENVKSEQERTNQFNKLFTNKIIMYLFEDAAKQWRDSLFSSRCTNKNRYSEICENFRTIGIYIFNDEIVNDDALKGKVSIPAQTVTP